MTLGSVTKLCYRYPTFYGFDYQTSEILVLKGENITREGDLIAVAEPSYISKEVHARFPRTHLEKDDLIISVRGEVGKVGLVPEGLIGSNINANTIRISLRQEAKDSEFFPEFIWLYLNSDLGQSQIRQFVAGGVQSTITAPELLEVRIPKFEMSFQKYLVGAMDAARAERGAKLAEASALLAGVDDYLLATLGLTAPPKDDRKVFAVQFGNLGKRVDPYSSQPRFRNLFAHIRASKYRVATFKEIATRIFSGVTPLAKGDAYVPPPDGVRFIRSGEITGDGEVCSTSEVHLSALIHNNMMKHSQLESGDLLIAIVGATIGAAGVFNRDEPANINQAIAAVRLKGHEISAEFACLYLRSSIGQALLDYFKRPVARANINLEEIGEIPLIIPPRDMQRAIVVEAHRWREEARCLRNEAEVDWHVAKRWFEDQLLAPV